MKHLLQFNRFIVLLVAMLTMSLTSAWAGTITSPYTWTLASGQLKTDAGTYTSGDVTWSFPGATYIGYDGSKGAQIGSSKNCQTSYSISTPISSFGTGATITKVVVNASMGSSGNAKLAIAVGDTSLAKQSLTTSAKDYTFDKLSVTSGNIVVSFSASSKAYYIKSIKVEFSAGGSDPSVSLNATTIDFGTVDKGATVSAKTIGATLTNTNAATASISGTAFAINPTGLTASGDITITPNTATVGEYSETLTLAATGATDAVATIKMNVVEPFVEEGVSFEQEWSAYTDWTYSNFASKQSGSITAHKGTYYGTTGGNSSGYMTTKNKINPDSIKFFVSKQSSNTNASSWKIQVSSDKSTWTDVKTVSATSMAQGTWVEVKEDLSKYTNVYVSIKYDGSTAVRNIDDVILTTRTLAKSEVTIATCQHGSVSASVGGSPISSGAKVEEGATVTLGNAPGDGYKLDAYSVKKSDQSVVEVKDGKFTMPNEAVTVSASFVQAKVLNSVEITKQPTTKEFWKGDTFTSEGLELTAHFSTGDEVVTPTSISGYDMATPGEQTVTVSYTEGTVTKSDTYDITVKTIANTAETAYSVDSARKLIDAGKDLATPVYVKGTISEIVTPWSGQYNNITYNISDDGLTTSAQFMLYRCATNGGAVGDDVVAYGTMKLFGETYEFASGNTIVSINKATTLSIENLSVTFGSAITPVIVTNIVGDYTIAYESDNTDVVVASGSTLSCGTTTGSANITATISATGYKGAETEFTVTVNPAGCTKLATISKGTELNGTFDLSVSGEQCADDAAISTVLTAVPNTHYHLASVTSLNAQEQTVGTIGEIVDNECTISGIEESTTITAIFEEDAKGTATFAKGAEAATGEAPADIEEYVGDNITLPANTFTYTGYKFAGWNDGTSTFAAGASYQMPEGGKTFTATWNELSKWATTYTSNVTGIGTSFKVKIGGVDYNANKQNKGASTKVTIPAGSTELHFHALAWTGEAQTITVSGLGENKQFAIVADGGVSGSGSTYTLQTDPSQVGYFSIPLSNIEADTEVTFAAASNKRFVLFGVNAVQPAALAIDPTSYDFGSVKEDASANKVFTITPNAFVEGDLTASFEGADAAKFSAVVDGNNVTVTFTPGEVRANMAATLKVSATNANVTASLTGTGIAAATPEIVVPAEPVNFGKIKQDATATDQQITVTLNNLDAATASISGSTFSIDKTDLVAGANTITISANTSAMGEKEETITITGEGAEEKQITVQIDVLSKWADVYTSNVGDDVLTEKVVIASTNYNAIKKGTGTASQSAVISVPKGTQTLHFHAAAWNNEATVLVVKQGDTELGSFELYKDAGVKSSSPFTLQGNNYSTEQYFHVSVAAYTATDAADITFTTTASPYRFVLYGVNQEGGIVPVLDRIEIGGTATKTEYEVGDTFDPAGLTVSAIYKLEGVDQPAVVVTDDVEWSFVPASLELTTTTVTATATYETKQASKDVAVTVSEPVPAITVEPATISFGTVEQGAELDAKIISVTIKNITSASVTLAGDGASAFEIDVTELTASGSVTVTPNTALAVNTYEATITIADNDSEEKKVVNVSMTLEPGDICDQDDDFEDDQSGTASTTYGNRSTTDGWTAVYTRMDEKDDHTYFSMNGKTTNVGIITSPVFHHGISALKFRYGNIAASDTKYSVRIEIKQGETVAYTEDLTNLSITSGEIFTKTIENINVAGDYQIVFTNLCPSNKTSNADRAAIGRICITEYADYARTVTPGNYGTLCLPNAVAAADMVGFEAFKVVNTDEAQKNLIIESVESLEAGHPYIILPSEATITCMFSGTAVDQPVAENGLHGTFQRIEAAVFAGMTHNNPYMLKDNKLHPCQGAAIAGANKAWIELGEVGTTAAPQRVGSRRVTLGTADSQTTTGLNTLGETKLGEPTKVLYNGQIIILLDGKMFNAQGQIIK